MNLERKGGRRMRHWRGEVIGSLIGAVFGLVYVEVNSGALAGPVAWPLRVAGLVAFLAVLVAIARSGPTRGEPGPGLGRGYWLVVLLEAIALVAGVRVLAGPLDRPDAGAAWVSLVVGLHFFALAVVLGERFFHGLGAAITACGAAGLVLALAGASEAAIDLVAGVVPGALLLGFAWWGVHRTPRPARAPADAPAG